MALLADDGISIVPADVFHLGADVDGYDAVVIAQAAFIDPPVRISFGARGHDAESRARELAATLLALADRLAVSR